MGEGSEGQRRVKGSKGEFTKGVKESEGGKEEQRAKGSKGHEGE